MSDFQERLAASDPVAGTSYAIRDADAMISRIMAQAPIRRRNLLRDFQLRMAGAVAMASLLTVGGIAAIDGAAPGLQLLAIGSLAHKSVATNASAPSMMMRLAEQFNFIAGSAISSSPSNGPAYQLVIPASGSAEVARIASVFGVKGSATNMDSNPTNWYITDSAGNTINFDSYGGVPNWYYSVNAPASPPSTSSSSGGVSQGSTTDATTTLNVPSNATLEADAQRYLKALDYGYQVAAPQFSSSTGTVANPDGTSTTIDQASITYSVVVDGLTTDQSVQFTFDSSNQLVSASGPAFGVTTPVQYPLQSPVAGVAVLNAEQQSYFTGGSGGSPTGGGGTVAPMSSDSSSTVVPTPTGVVPGTSPGSSGPADTSVTTTTAPSAPPIVNVTLDSVATSLQSYVLSDGSVWFLPVYTYTGNVVASDGSSYASSWTTIAVDPTYVQIKTSSGGLGSGGPIAY